MARCAPAVLRESRTTRRAVVTTGAGLAAHGTVLALARSVRAADPRQATGGGATQITTLVLADGSATPADLPTYLGFAATGGPHGATGHFMNLHGDVAWLEVDDATARFGGDPKFGPYRVAGVDGPTPTLSLRWTDPFAPGVVGTEEVLQHGSVRASALPSARSVWRHRELSKEGVP